MNNRHSLRAAFLGSLAIAALLRAAPQDTAQQWQAPPTFRSGVVVVPIDVRVVDRDGLPVTDLEREDFTILEDGVPQHIVHFSSHVLAARSPEPGLRASSDVPAVDLSPPHGRVFLIVLGAGALGSMPLLSVSPSGSVHGPRTVQDDPSKALDGLLHLLRERLLPQDQVAVLAYNRASDFTTDHGALAKALEAFRTSEEAGIAALGRLTAPRPTSLPADSLYAAPDVPFASNEALGFAEYVEARNRRTSDRENVHYGLRYLRFMEGEKHLVYVTANGMPQPPPGFLKPEQVRETAQELAAGANDARVVLDIVQTGGVSANPGNFLPPLPILKAPLIDPRVFGLMTFGTVGTSGGSNVAGSGGEPVANATQPGWDRPPLDRGVAIPGNNALGFEAWSELRTLAELTGGTVSIARSATDAVDRIDATTRAGYLLAYSPSNSSLDGRYRAVTVEVQRPNVTVLFRHGYYGSRAVASLDRTAIVTEGRIATAALSTKDIRDIRITASSKFTRDPTGRGGTITVQLKIDSSRLVWTTDELSRRVTHVQVLLSCGSATQQIVGQTQRQLNLALADERFREVSAKGLDYSVQVPVSAPPRYVKVVVYNLESDLVGTVTTAMK